MIAIEESLSAAPLLSRLHNAQQEGKLVKGPHQVWKEACRKNASMLIVENSYACHVHHVDMENICIAHDSIDDVDLNRKNLLDNIIGNVLQAGGSVRYVDDGVLREYRGIALLLNHPPLSSVY